MALATLTVDLILKAGGFESDMNRASKSAQKRMKEIEQSARAAGAVIGTAIAAGAGIAAAALKSAIDSADRIDELSQSMGITAQQLSRLQLAAKFGAVDLETLGTAFGRLSKAQLAFSEGNKETVALFNALGVNGDVARNTAEVMQDLADVFARMPDSAQKTALAMELFGKAGANLIPFLNQGGDRIQELQEKADRLGITLSNETAKAAGEFNDQLDIMKFAAQGLAAQVAKELLPDLLKLTEAFASNATQGDRVSEAAQNIAASFRVVGSVVGAVYNAMRYLGESFGAVIAQTKSYFEVAKQIMSLQGWQNGQAGIKNAIGNARMQYDLAFDSQTGSGSGVPSNFTFVPPPPPAKSMPPGLADYLSRNNKPDKAPKDDSARRAAEAARELASATDALNSILDSQAAIIGGDLQAAAFDYRDTLIDLAEAERVYAEQGKLSGEVQAALDQARTQADAQYQSRIELIRSQKSEADKLIESMQFELDLMRMTAEERAVAIALRQLDAKATDEQRAAVERLARAQIEEARAQDEFQKQIDALDDFRDSFANNVEDVLSGTKSIGDAFRDMVSDIIAQMARAAAQKFTESLFGGFGQPAGGSGGGFLSALMSFLPGFATGTDYAPGGWAVVGEKGPEIVNLPRGSSVTPNHALGSGVTQNIYVTGTVDRRSASQLAQRSAESQRMAMSRNG